MGTCTNDANENGKSVSGLWYVGVILGIIGSVGTNMGVNLQKYSFMREAKRSVNLKRPYVRQPLWVIGLLLVVAGSIMDFGSLGFLPQTLATPIGGTTMVANVAFASIFLKEKFSRIDALGTGLVLSGIALVAGFATKESECYTVKQLLDLYQEPPFVVYLVIVAMGCVGTYALTKRLERLVKLFGSSSPKYKKFRRIHPITYPALSGIFGAQSELLAKCTAELVKTTIEGTNQFVSFGTYAIVLSMFTCIFLQIHWLATGLQHFDAVFIVPVFQCFFISVSIFGGGVYFNEFSNMSTLSLVMFFLGVCVTLSGVSLLSRRQMNVLRPRGKVRAAVRMVIFIKRVQKLRNLDYHWTQPDTALPEKGTVEKCIAATDNVKMIGLPKISKATVVPIGVWNDQSANIKSEHSPDHDLVHPLDHDDKDQRVIQIQSK